eukprot:m.124720 g.124720  ORF g.124720 m.124720 type:complete len:233 (+) comp37853_c0_seq7:337-1035(+)
MGDWTEKMAKRCGMGVKGTEFKQTYEMPKILIDGPFGTPSEDIFKHEVGIGIGAGIGVTPFASILKSLWYQSLDPHTTMKLKKVYFFWICPDTGAFEWFQSLLQHLEEQMLERGTTDFLEYHIYLTRGWDPKMAREIYMKEDEEGDIITGLQQKTNYGRPHWDNIFAELGRRHPGVDMGVFFCGPKVLSSVLHKKCNEHSDASGTDGARFFYNKENFCEALSEVYYRVKLLC